jgi:hypothetical protein
VRGERRLAAILSAARPREPFFNPGEAFNVRLFFDGEPADCEVTFRMEGVKHSVRQSDRITAFGPEGLNFVVATIFPRPLRRLFRLYIDWRFSAAR